MIEVRYQGENGLEDRIHKIDIKKVERFEKDGTFLVKGIDNGYSVTLHLSIDPLGNIFKIPHTSAENLKLMLPVYKKVNVTKNMIDQLNGKVVRVLATSNEKKEKKNVTFYYHPTLRKIFMTKATAYELGLSDKVHNDMHVSTVITKDTDLNKDFLEISNVEFDTLKERCNINVVYFKIVENIKEETPFNDLGDTYVDSEIKKLLMDLKYNLEKQGKVDNKTRNIIMQLIQRERTINNLPNGAYKDELREVLYLDLLDIVSTVQGLNLSEDRVVNYNKKAVCLRKILKMKEVDLDLSNVIELVDNIEEALNEAYKLNNMIEPRTWYLIETFVINLVETLIISDRNKFRLEISKFNENDLTYGQIMFELRNFIEGKNTAK